MYQSRCFIRTDRNEVYYGSFNEELGLNIPGHVAVILDGNGRWAKKRHMPRTYGHIAWEARLLRICYM